MTFTCTSLILLQNGIENCNGLWVLHSFQNIICCILSPFIQPKNPCNHKCNSGKDHFEIGEQDYFSFPCKNYYFKHKRISRSHCYDMALISESSVVELLRSNLSSQNNLKKKRNQYFTCHSISLNLKFDIHLASIVLK